MSEFMWFMLAWILGSMCVNTILLGIALGKYIGKSKHHDW